MDQVNGRICKCKPGYTGNRCHVSRDSRETECQSATSTPLWMCLHHCECVYTTVDVSSTLWMCLQHCGCVLTTVSFFYTTVMCLQHCGCVYTTVNVSTPLWMCLYTIVNVSTLPWICIHHCECVYTIVNVSTPLWMCLHNYECVYTIRNVSTQLWMCLHNYECVYTTMNVSTQLGMCLHYYKCVYTTMNMSVLPWMCLHHSEYVCVYSWTTMSAWVSHVYTAVHVRMNSTSSRVCVWMAGLAEGVTQSPATAAPVPVRMARCATMSSGTTSVSESHSSAQTWCCKVLRGSHLVWGFMLVGEPLKT